jgi:hypothetical protein
MKTFFFFIAFSSFAFAECQEKVSVTNLAQNLAEESDVTFIKVLPNRFAQVNLLSAVFAPDVYERKIRLTSEGKRLECYLTIDDARDQILVRNCSHKGSPMEFELRARKRIPVICQKAAELTGLGKIKYYNTAVKG